MQSDFRMGFEKYTQKECWFVQGGIIHTRANRKN